MTPTRYMHELFAEMDDRSLDDAHMWRLWRILAEIMAVSYSDGNENVSRSTVAFYRLRRDAYARRWGLQRAKRLGQEHLFWQRTAAWPAPWRLPELIQTRCPRCGGLFAVWTKAQQPENPHDWNADEGDEARCVLCGFRGVACAQAEGGIIFAYGETEHG